MEEILDGHGLDRRTSLFCSMRLATNKHTIFWVKRQLKRVSPSIKIKSTEFKFAGSRLKCECKQCGHLWDQSWTELQRGTGCRVCGQRKAANSVKLTHELVVNRLHDINPCIRVLGKYQGCMTPLKCLCLTCKHIWNPIWAELSRNHGCPKCARTNSMLSASEIAKRMQSRGVIALSGYSGASTNAMFVCAKYKHKWRAKWGDIIRKDGRGTGCPHCADSINERTARRCMEEATGWKFPKCRPSFLKGRGKQPMELDGFNIKHRLGFEYQGQQHYLLMRHWGGNTALAAQRRRDDRKRHLCHYHGVRIVRIPYWIRDIEVFVLTKLQQYGVI